jgi:thioredoxin-dependent peroxiredoxin
MTELSVGDRAPNFNLPSANGKSIVLSNLAGRSVVLYFYPKDDTEACTAEAIDFSALTTQFENAGATVVGVSPDSPTKHARFMSKHSLRVELASDESLETAKAYGVWVEKSMYGRKYMGVERSTFLIGRDGTVCQIWRKVRVKNHAADLLEAVKALPHI